MGALTLRELETCARMFSGKWSGTFLDEVGELPLALQAKLLTAIELHGEKGALVRHIRAVGEELAHRVDVRLVLGTHRDLWADAAAGRFRLDLLGRISTHVVRLPALVHTRHRILGTYLERLEQMERNVSSQSGLPVRFVLHREAVDALQDFALSHSSRWTWNFRDVEQSAERLALLAWSHRRGEARRVGISPELVGRERRFLEARWRSMAGSAEPRNRDPEDGDWADLRKTMHPERVESPSELERWEARWLLQARHATRNLA